ncbi:MAG TPA: HemK family protein methyltransferase [Candidatus Absconditabacterales bacterium]|nr:HemK family protein methyltransferase [Candidatus Absconditabacterales bacterium]HOQ78687.1 HemK family protein methyltransferase [Candidatus Absconditabacterales bacterium]HPK27990.1 HemK family protein methyltransferase [Candidatus Absconditabacterales bacterium]
MKIQELLQNQEYTQKRVLENLICYFLDISRENLRISLDQDIEESVINKIIQAYDDFVVQKKPLEYILGYVEFMRNKFKIDHRALIPRPETEYMIQAVNEHVSTLKPGNNILFDIGTGCGVLGLSVLLHNPSFFTEAYLSEYVDYTLSLAQENFEIFKPRLGKTKVNLVQSNLLNFVKDISLSDSNLILVANLPYIPENTFDQNVGENVKNREPKPAFVGGEDGLDYYREMFQQIFDFGIKPTMFLEMMTRQVDVLRKEFGEKIKFQETKTFHFNIRIVKARIK